METDLSTSNQCPPVENLSAWFDQEFVDSNIDKHIKDCENCQECIRDFERINDSIESNIKVDDETILKISEKCIHEISMINTREDKTGIPLWLKIAACFLIVGVVFALRSSSGNFFGGKNQGLAQGQKSDNIKVANQTQNKVNKNPGEVINAERVYAGDTSNKGTNSTTVSIDNLTYGSDQIATSQISSRGSAQIGVQGPNNSKNINLVGFDIPESNRPKFRDLAGEDVSHSSEYLTDHYVHHVWRVDDPKIPLTALKRFLNSQDQIFDNLIEENRDRYRLRFSIEDKSLFELVNRLSGIGCELLSPETSPQLESIDIPGFDGKVIRYELEIVTK